MNPLHPALSSHPYSTSLTVGQPVNTPGLPAQLLHPQTLSLAGMSRNTLDALEQTNQGHQPLAMKAIQFIADSSMSLQSAEGRDAYFINVHGDLAIHAHLNDQARYDVISISASTGEPVFLSVPPPATTHSPAPSIVSAQASSSCRPAEYPRSDLMQALIEQHNPQGVTDTPQPSGAPLVLKGASNKRIQDPDNPGKTITLGAWRRRERVDDLEHPGRTVSLAALNARRSGRQQVDDPDNPGQTISRNVRHQRQQVDDPDNPGQTISRSQRNDRQQVDDPNNPGQTISRNMRNQRQQVDDPANPGKTISRSLRSQRQQVDDLDNPGQTISRNLRNQRQQVVDPENSGKTLSRFALNNRKKRDRRLAADVENV